MRTKTKISERPITKESLLKFGFSSEFLNAQIHNFPSQDEPVMACKKYLQDLEGAYRSADGFYLWGNPGIGKSRLAQAVFLEIVSNRFRNNMRTVRVVDFENIVSQLSRSGSGGEMPSKIHMMIKSADYLLIDNLPRVSSYGNFAEKILLSMLNTRVHARKPTWITTTIMPSEFSALYSSCEEAVKTLSIPIKCDFEDMRSKIRKEKISKYVSRS